MNISETELQLPTAIDVTLSEETLDVSLSDGRTISVPIAWYPRLMHAGKDERVNWRLIGKGHGIHWSDLDEDISVEALLAGKPSLEDQKSLQKWLNDRSA